MPTRPAVYYNDSEPFVAQWLRNLIAAGHLPAGDVDERPIQEVQPDDVRGYAQCHFFAGIGGWPLALRLAGWPDDRAVWTGSCPCQALSSAARGHHTAADLWPDWCNLIIQCLPTTILGEQVAGGAGQQWMDTAADDLEALGYEVGADILPAVSIGQDHARPRIYFVAHTNRNAKPSRALHAQTQGLQWHRGERSNVAAPHGLSRRVAVLRAYGNAIVPQVAAAFIEAVMECCP